MNYRAFQLRAVVDFIEFEIQTVNPSNFKAVRRALREILCQPPPYVTVLDADELKNSTRFRFSIQDPDRFFDLDELFQKIIRKLPLKTPPSVTAMEIAFDTYSEGASIRRLAEIACDRYRFCTVPPGDSWHFYRKGGEKPQLMNEHVHEKALNRREIVKRLEDQWQLADVRHKNTDVRFHIYVKTVDCKDEDGKPAHIPPTKWRARFEVTLQGAKLPCRTLEELKCLDFSSLSKHFKFHRLADDLHPMARHALNHWSGRQHGRRGNYRRKHKTIIGKYSGSSVFRGSTVADDPLNRAAFECLRTLTREWVSKKPGADFTEESGHSTAMKDDDTNKPSTRMDADDMGNSLDPVNADLAASALIMSLEGDTSDITSSTSSLCSLHLTQHTNGRNCDRSNEPASPIQPDLTHGAIDELMQQFNSTPEAIQNFERIEQLFRGE